MLAAVVDWAVARPEMDPRRLVLMGRSFGGYLAPCAASGDPRFAALVADPGLYDLDLAIRASLSPDVYDPLQAKDPQADESFAAQLAAAPRRAYFFMSRAAAHGARTAAEYVRMLKRYTLVGRAERIRCPTFVAVQEQDPLAPQARLLYEALTCPKTLVTFAAQDGAAGHCEAAGQLLFHQRVFDWLDETLRGRG